jgi:hypothetical protein
VSTGNLGNSSEEQAGAKHNSPEDLEVHAHILIRQYPEVGAANCVGAVRRGLASGAGGWSGRAPLHRVPASCLRRVRRRGCGEARAAPQNVDVAGQRRWGGNPGHLHRRRRCGGLIVPRAGVLAHGSTFGFCLFKEVLVDLLQGDRLFGLDPDTVGDHEA